MYPEGAEQPATGASPAAPRHAPGFRSEEGNHIRNQICMEMLDLPPPPLLPPAGPEAGHQDTMPALCWRREQLFSQHPEASHNPATRLTHPCAHQAGEKGDTLPVQSHCPPTTPPALPARPVLKIHTNQSSVSVSSSPMPRGSARLPTTCPRAMRPPRTRMQCHTPKSTPPPKRSSRTRGQHWPSCGHMDSMWTAHFLQRKLAQSRDLVAVDTPQLWGGETEA